MKLSQNPVCGRSDCFGCVDGECRILTAATKRQPCPFFKTFEQYRNDRERADILNKQAELRYRSAMLQMQQDKPTRGNDKHQKNRREEESGF